jgi:hypothetical protein
MDAETRLKLRLGDLIFQVSVLEAANAALQQQIAELQKQVPPKPAADPAAAQ